MGNSVEYSGEPISLKNCITGVNCAFQLTNNIFRWIDSRYRVSNYRVYWAN